MVFAVIHRKGDLQTLTIGAERHHRVHRHANVIAVFLRRCDAERGHAVDAIENDGLRSIRMTPHQLPGSGKFVQNVAHLRQRTFHRWIEGLARILAMVGIRGPQVHGLVFARHPHVDDTATGQRCRCHHGRLHGLAARLSARCDTNRQVVGAQRHLVANIQRQAEAAIRITFEVARDLVGADAHDCAAQGQLRRRGDRQQRLWLDVHDKSAALRSRLLRGSDHEREVRGQPIETVDKDGIHHLRRPCRRDHGQHGQQQREHESAESTRRHHHVNPLK